jgi:hypothetical protein
VYIFKFNSKPTSMLVPSAYVAYCTKCRKVTDVVRRMDKLGKVRVWGASRGVTGQTNAALQPAGGQSPDGCSEAIAIQQRQGSHS